MTREVNFQPLIDFLQRVPAIRGSIGHGEGRDLIWWVKFTIDTDDKLAWRVVQELGHVLNYLSVNERLPTRFMPVSPPPYLNGGVEFLSWTIECDAENFSPGKAAEWLEDCLNPWTI